MCFQLLFTWFILESIFEKMESEHLHAFAFLSLLLLNPPPPKPPSGRNQAPSPGLARAASAGPAIGPVGRDRADARKLRGRPCTASMPCAARRKEHQKHVKLWIFFA